jgi:tRNA(adenine34) deaminase
VGQGTERVGAPVDVRWMGEALALAAAGFAVGELPIGAVVVAGGRVVGGAHTQELGQRRLLVHAELLALDEADRETGWDRGLATLFTTLEPCLMCLAATATAMVGRIVYALPSPGDGAARRSGSGRVDLTRIARIPSLSRAGARVGGGRGRGGGPSRRRGSGGSRMPSRGRRSRSRRGCG